MRSSSIVTWDVLEKCSTISKPSPANNKPNVAQAINTQSRNTHDRGPQRWPNTHREIYARKLYGTRFRRTSGNVSIARGLAGICNPTVATGLNYQTSHLMRGEAPEHTHHLGFNAAALRHNGASA
jgi:hypothetical protein